MLSYIFILEPYVYIASASDAKTSDQRIVEVTDGRITLTGNLFI